MTPTIEHIPAPLWGQPGYEPPTPPQKKTHPARWIIGFGLVLLIGVAAISGRSSISDAVGITKHTVVYKVEGTTNMASITYENAGGDSSQQNDVDVPLTLKSGAQGITLNGMRSGAFLYISAQNSQEYGSVTCAIEVDGVRVKQNTSRGGYTIATCSGRL